jgi:hypothetical protein
MAKKREVIGGEYVTIGAKTHYVPVYKEEEVVINPVEERVIVPVKEKEYKQEIVIGASYYQFGISGNLMYVEVDKNTGEVVMSPGTPFFYWILGILWDKRFLRRGRCNIVYKLMRLRAISHIQSQCIYQGFRGLLAYIAYDSYLDSLTRIDNYNNLYLMWSAIIVYSITHIYGRYSDRMDERDLIDRYNSDGLQAAVTSSVNAFI